MREQGMILPLSEYGTEFGRLSEEEKKGLKSPEKKPGLSEQETGFERLGGGGHEEFKKRLKICMRGSLRRGNPVRENKRLDLDG